MEGGCVFNVREDPNETNDLAKTMPDILHSLKARYLELRATGPSFFALFCEFFVSFVSSFGEFCEFVWTAYDQMTPIKKAYEPAFAAQVPLSFSLSVCQYEPAFAAQMNTLYTAALKKYQGFQGPFWGTTDDEAINDYDPK